jgi:hypothetical protein
VNFGSLKDFQKISNKTQKAKQKTDCWASLRPMALGLESVVACRPKGCMGPLRRPMIKEAGTAYSTCRPMALSVRGVCNTCGHHSRRAHDGTVRSSSPVAECAFSLHVEHHGSTGGPPGKENMMRAR